MKQQPSSPCIVLVVAVLSFTPLRAQDVEREAPAPAGRPEQGVQPESDRTPPSAREGEDGPAPVPEAGEAPAGKRGSPQVPPAEGPPPPPSERTSPVPETDETARPKYSKGIEELIPPDQTRLRMSLDYVLRVALRNNLDRHIEELNRDIAMRQVVIERAVFDPFFNAGFTMGRNRDPTVNLLDVGLTPVLGVIDNPSERRSFNAGFRGNTIFGTSYELSAFDTRLDTPETAVFSLNPRYNSGVQLTLTQPLLKNAWYNVNSANLRLARNNLGLSQEAFQLRIIQISLDVIQAYWELVFAARNYAARSNALDLAREQLRIETAKADIGVTPPVDLITFRAQVALRETELDQALSQLETARDLILDRMNYAGQQSLRKLWSSGNAISPFDNVMVIPTTEPQTEFVEVERNDALALAFANRAEFRQSNLLVRNQEIAVEVAKNGLLPDLGVTGSWSQLGLDGDLGGSLSSLNTGKFYNWSVGVTMEIPILYRGLIAAYRNAQSELAKARYELHRTENTIVLEVDQAIRNLGFAHRAVQNLARQVELQKELLEAEKTKVRVGSSISYAVTQIENDLVEIMAQELRAQTDFENAKAEYERAVGTLLKRWGITLGETD